MTYLLDTCTFLWLIQAQGKLSKLALKTLKDSASDLRLHQATIWEMQIKVLAGKLSFRHPLSETIAHALEEFDLNYTYLQDTDIWHLEKMPFHHKDPFDRILIAHALYEGIPILTPDPEIHKYSVRCVW